jgi:spore maturation protein CgeB
MFVLVKVDFWNSPMSVLRINEAPSLKKDKEFISLAQEDLYGDAYFHVVEQGDMRMEGFMATIGKGYHTIPLAADRISLIPSLDEKFVSDLAYIGTNLPEKRDFFRKNVYPLANQWKLKIYGQDWTTGDYLLGWVQRAGQYFNVPGLRSLRKPKLALTDEAKIYRSAKVSINVHEAYQREFGGDCNERTFKIPFCGGFQVVDSVACINKYFPGEGELVMASNEREWVDLIHYYLENPEKRGDIIAAGQKRVLNEHTYHHRARQILGIMDNRLH